MVLIDQWSGRSLYATYRVERDDPWIVVFTQSKEDCISQLEALAGVSAVNTFSKELAGRRVVHFVVVTSALSSFAHGYISRPDRALLSNAFYLILAQHSADVWLEWIPSEANVTDLPSRVKGDDWWSSWPCKHVAESSSLPGAHGREK